MAPDPRPPRARDKVTVILHRPAIPENIGSVCRAMKNTGFDRLILSCPETRDWATAGKLAVSASDILEAAPRTGSLEEAVVLSGASHLVGTTGRARKYWETDPFEAAAGEILRRAADGGVALLFGPESTGLSNEELTLCHMTVTIPSERELASYNLAQAVLLVLFALMTRSSAPTPAADSRRPGFEELEGMYGHIRELLTETSFLLEENPDHMMIRIREFLNRADPREEEVKMVRGVCRRLLRHIRNRDR